MPSRRDFVKALPAIWLAAPSLVEAKPVEVSKEVETLRQMLDRLKDKIAEDIPGLTKVEINYDPSNAKVPLTVVALRI